ncbi:30S ribosomal protein S18 [Candidatus Wolfebacteria bacterium]|nr:30S ribosomal protein S18 [Candidatus Wolfebacteria bacterium]
MKDEEKNIETPRFVDYKDTEYLKSFVNPHARINNRRRTRISSKQQRKITQAIKRARFMALMPYITQ